MKELLALSNKSITLRRHEYLVTPGQTDKSAYYIANGSLRIFVMIGEEERVVRFGYAGNLVVALDSFFGGGPTGLYIQALKKTTVHCIHKDQIQRHSDGHAHGNYWIDALQDLVLQQHERELDLLVQSPLQRYQRVRARSPRLFQEIPGKHIANYLGMTPETLSRIKKA